MTEKKKKKVSFWDKILMVATRFNDLQDREYDVAMRERELKLLSLDLMLKDHYQHLKVVDYLYSTAVK